MLNPSRLQQSVYLETFWFTYRDDANFPAYLGVTAYSLADARTIIYEEGAANWLIGYQEVKVQIGVRIDELDQNHIVPNSGPMQFRGLWFPCLNIGFGAPKAAVYRAYLPCKPIRNLASHE
jgi:hypothetical protein